MISVSCFFFVLSMEVRCECVSVCMWDRFTGVRHRRTYGVVQAHVDNVGLSVCASPHPHFFHMISPSDALNFSCYGW